MDRFEHVKDKIKESQDLVTLIESYVPVRRRGRSVVALCPFHDEKTPSFTIYPDTQHFKCYGCGKAGDVFTFVMEREGLSFREALEVLAERAGVSTEGLFGGGRRDAPRVDVHGTLAQVRDFFRAALDTEPGAFARNYLAGRRLDAAVDTFGLGVHPPAPGALLRFARSRKLPQEILEQAGLLAKSSRDPGEIWEPFRGRVMFPIEDERGRVVGFGGRQLEDGPRKYVNSPEAPFFRKGRVLYGLPQAKRAGVRQIVVMEGYTDVIACHLAGFAGAVATLGTAFTSEHARVLHRYATDGVVLLFDGDRAGRAAAERAFGELVKTELPVRIALMDEGSDPADLLAGADGAARFQAVLASAEDALTVWFRLKRKAMDLTLEANVARALEECSRVLDGVDDPARREVLVGRMAGHLGLDVETARRSLAGRRKRTAVRRAAPPASVASPPAASGAAEQSDLELVACLLAEPGLFDQIEAEAFTSTAAARLAELLAGVAASQVDPTSVRRFLFTRCADDPVLSQCLARCIDVAETIKEPRESLANLMAARRVYFSRQAARQTRMQLQKAKDEGDAALVDELTRTYLQYLRQA